MDMNAIHIVPYIGDISSGPAYSVPQLCHSLSCKGVGVSLHTLEPLPEMDLAYAIMGYRRHVFPVYALGRSPEMLRALQQECLRSEIIHNHSLWMYPNIYSEWARRGTQCRLVVSPRGTLSTWSLNRSRWKKKCSWWLGQRQALLNADLLHATGEKEYEEIRQFGLKQPVAIIPNGINIPEVKAMSGDRRRILMFLGRIHPVKGIEDLLYAWKSLQKKYFDWDLKIVGPDQSSYASQMKKLAYELRLERIQFDGELGSEAKFNALSNASLLVLPSHTENFGMVVVEALACGVPVLTTKGTPWKDLTTRGCGWCIDVGRMPLTECLGTAMKLPSETLSSMGRIGRGWMKNDFSWEHVGMLMSGAYSWLVHGGYQPEWIYND